jgi:uncharacterized membrane protein YhaH (DUF805 family)
MEGKGLYTSFDGRISRKMWWIGTLILVLAFILLYFLLLRYFDIRLMDSFFDPSIGPDRKLSNMRNTELVGFAVLAIIALPLTALMKKRLQDRDRPNWLFYVIWVPNILDLLLNLFGHRYALYNENGETTVLSTWAG